MKGNYTVMLVKEQAAELHQQQSAKDFIRTRLYGPGSRRSTSMEAEAQTCKSKLHIPLKAELGLNVQISVFSVDSPEGNRSCSPHSSSQASHGAILVRTSDKILNYRAAY